MECTPASVLCCLPVPGIGLLLSDGTATLQTPLSGKKTIDTGQLHNLSVITVS